MSIIFNPLSGTFDFTGSVDVGTFSSTPVSNGLSISGETLTLHAADATNPGALTTSSQSIAGVKTFSSQINADSGLDRSTSGTLSIGTSSNSTTINIGNSGATVNVQGTTFYENVTQLQVKDPLITLNKGGASGSASNSGIELEENGSITGYAETSGDRNSWTLKAPNTAGIATITPGSSGITLDQSSHNPVTIGTANGLSLSTQQLSLALASTSTTGALSNTDWNTFNNKQAAGSYITALTGDVVASGPGSASSTIQSGVISNSHINASAAIAVSKLAALTVSKAVVTNSSGVLTTSATTDTQIGYLSNVSSDVQTQINNKATIITGDIEQTSFTIGNNTAVAADVTSLAFANATVRSALVQYSIVISATSSLYEAGTLYLIQKGSSWEIARTTVGDDSLVQFTVTNAGQVQYTSGTYSGYTTGKMEFRATVTSV